MTVLGEFYSGSMVGRMPKRNPNDMTGRNNKARKNEIAELRKALKSLRADHRILLNRVVRLEHVADKKK